MSELIITIEHVRAARIAGAGTQCAPGIRAWFNHHELSLTDFLQNGLSESRLRATNCAFALRAIEVARLEAESGQQQ